MAVQEVASSDWSDPTVLAADSLISCVQGSVRVTTSSGSPDLFDGVFLDEPNDSIDFPGGMSVRFRNVGLGVAKVSIIDVAAP